MKLILSILLLTIANMSFAEIIILEEAVETHGIKVEYSSVSKRGFIYPSRCDLCDRKVYEFNGPLEVTREGNPISFDTFLVDYPNAEYPTLLLDPKSFNVLRVVY